MSESKVTGVIDGISDYKDKDYFNIALGDSNVDDNWYIGDGTLRDYGEFDKGDKVRLTVENGNVSKVEPVGKPNVTESGASEDEATREGDAEGDSPVGGSTGSDQSYTSKDDRINKKVAFKEAVETVRQSTDLDLDSVESGGEHMDEVAKLANGYYNILSDMGGEEQ